ncbi:MAG: hypothetical protein ACFB13_02415 [Kiloniellaceae bacterium]|mgnify:CR=1 FL=1
MGDFTSPHFRVGGVLGSSFRILAANLPAFILIPALALAPAIAAIGTGLWFDLFESSDAFLFAFAFVTAALLSLVLCIVARAAVIYGTFRHFTGQRLTLGDMFSNGLRHAWRVFSVGLVSELLISLGYAFFLIPGLYLSTLYWVVMPAAVVEDSGVGDSLRRSSRLTDGCRWKIFGLLLVWSALQYLLENLPGALIDITDFHPAAVIVAWLAISLSVALGGIVDTVSYCRLRQIREGIGADEIAAVFD